MGLRDSWKQARGAMAAGWKGDGLPAEALAALTPEQRAAYDARMAEVAEAKGQVAEQHRDLVDDHAARFEAQPLQGPAGEWLYGPASYPGVDPAALEGLSVHDLLRGELNRLGGQAGDLAGDPLGVAGPPTARPPAPADQRDAVAASERTARDAARAPYAAPERATHAITRIPARSGSELDDVAAHLAATGLSARPDLVFGCYRVPDHIGLGTARPERSRYVEWDVVHAAGADGLPPAPPPVGVTIDGGERWVERAAGEPSVLDEDLAVAYLASIGVGPERTFGLARQLVVRSMGSGVEGDASTTVARVPGIHVLHAAEDRSTAAARFDAWAAARPVPVPEDGHPGVHVEVLNWGAIAEAVRPQSHRPPPVPSPFPYLPSTPQELLDAYLEVVGLHPAHCYAASVVEDELRSIDGVDRLAAGLVGSSTNVGASLPCADGENRRRLFGGVHVVVAHLDAPAYAEGRERWARYEAEVLQANLAAETGVRRPVHDERYSELPAGLGNLLYAAGRVERAVDTVLGLGFGPEWIAPHRYCWPASR